MPKFLPIYDSLVLLGQGLGSFPGEILPYRYLRLKSPFSGPDADNLYYRVDPPRNMFFDSDNFKTF